MEVKRFLTYRKKLQTHNVVFFFFEHLKGAVNKSLIITREVYESQAKSYFSLRFATLAFEKVPWALSVLYRIALDVDI